MPQRLKSIIPKSDYQLQLQALKRAISTGQLDDGWWVAEVDGEPMFGVCCGSTEEIARRSMEIYLDDNKGSVEVVLAN